MTCENGDALVTVKGKGEGARLRGTHVLEEDLENTTGLLVDETRDTLDTTSAGKTADSGFGDTWRRRQERTKRSAKSTYPECCHEESCGGAWLRPFRDPFHPFRGQT